jgi:WD40 repeat protein/ABC-type dipeptide/oligopeptide/nickel transport system ATPase component
MKNNNPFPGIRSYEFNEDHLFFGREYHIEKLLKRLNKSKFLAIIGSSGCGKSSLIKAGLMPSLIKQKNTIFQGDWSVSLFRPGDDPIGNLAASLFSTNRIETNFSETYQDIQSIEDELKSGKDGISKVLANQRFNKNKLIVIDQFEELFRFKQTKKSFRNITEDKFFTQLIVSAVEQIEMPVYFLVSMRTDFLDECTEYRKFTELINKGKYLVPRMSDEEKSIAITGPLSVFNVDITDKLLERLLKDVGDDPDQLPIMQHAMMRTYDYWKSTGNEEKPVDIAHYEAIGTMKEAISIHAEEIYGEFYEESDHRLIEKIFKALTDYSSDNRGTRRPMILEDLVSTTGAREEKIMRIIDRFRLPGRAFLMPPYGHQLTPETTVDISHEALMRIWKRLRKWIEQEIDSGQLYLRLSKSAELYQKGEGGLWVNPELQVGLNWFQREKPNISWARRYDPAFDRAIQFLKYSQKEHERVIALKEEKQKRELKRTRNFAFFLGTASVVSILLLVISLNMRFKAESKEKEAIEQSKIALMQSKNAEEQKKNALIQKKISEQQQQIAEQQKLLTEEQKQYAIQQQVIAQNQRGIAERQKRKAVESEKVAIEERERAVVLQKEAEKQEEIARIQEKQARIAEGKAKRLRLLALARSLAIQSEEMPKNEIGKLPSLLALQAYTFNKKNGGPENQTDIYTALLKSAKGESILREHKEMVRKAIVLNNKDYISCGDDGKVYYWKKTGDSYSHSLIKTGFDRRVSIRALAVTQKNDYLAVGSEDGTVIIIKNPGTTNDQLLKINPERSIIKGLGFTNENNLLACYASGKVLSIPLNGEPEIIQNSSKPITSFYLNTSLNAFATGTSDGFVNIHSLNKTFGSFELGPYDNSAVTAIVFKDLKELFVGNESGKLSHTYQGSGNSYQTTILSGHSSAITGIDYNSDKKVLVTSSYDGTIRINYISTEGQFIVLNNHDSWVMDVKLSKDAAEMISCSNDKTVRVTVINSDLLAKKICNSTDKYLNQTEWTKYIGSDIPFEQPCENK